MELRQAAAAAAAAAAAGGGGGGCGGAPSSSSSAESIRDVVNAAISREFQRQRDREYNSRQV